MLQSIISSAGERWRNDQEDVAAPDQAALPVEVLESLQKLCVLNIVPKQIGVAHAHRRGQLRYQGQAAAAVQRTPTVHAGSP